MRRIVFFFFLLIFFICLTFCPSYNTVQYILELDRLHNSPIVPMPIVPIVREPIVRPIVNVTYYCTEMPCL